MRIISENVEKKMNHDYAGVTMKLCKVFERELNIIIFNKWRVELRKQFTIYILPPVRIKKGVTFFTTR